jgi:hypothetical protein
MDTVERPPRAQGDLKAQHSTSREKFEKIKQNLSTTRPLVLFDLNGILVKHFYDAEKPVTKRHKFVVRPGIYNLARLHDAFDIGIYSSSTKNTVEMALREIEGHVKLNLCKILHRRDCVLVKAALKKMSHTCTAQQIKPWDTFKPLKKHFQNISNIALIDDSPHKSFPGEEENMIVLPSFQPPSRLSDKDYYSGEGDGVIKLLVDSMISSLTEKKSFGDAIALVRTIFDRLNDLMAQEIWSTVIAIMGSGQPTRANFVQDQQNLQCQLVLPGGNTMRGLLVQGTAQQSVEHHDAKTRDWIWVRIIDVFIPDQVVLCEEIRQQAESQSNNSLEGMIGSLSLQ